VAIVVIVIVVALLEGEVVVVVSPTTTHLLLLLSLLLQLSIALPAENWLQVKTSGVSYLCFLMGCIISGIMIQHETFYLGK